MHKNSFSDELKHTKENILIYNKYLLNIHFESKTLFSWSFHSSTDSKIINITFFYIKRLCCA